MDDMGFKRVSGLESINFTYLGRQSELDDAFYCENVLILMEYTNDSNPGDHLKKKSFIYERIMQDTAGFINFVKDKDSPKPLANCIRQIEAKYPGADIQLRIIYASRNPLDDQHKSLVKNITYFDYQIVKYFEVIAKAIKKSAQYEFFQFANISYELFGDNILQSTHGSSDDFTGEILPPTRNSQYEDLTIVSFYIDPYALLKRSYVLRNDSWKNEDNISLFQRLLVPRKIRAMRSFLSKEQRVFVNNIIVALSPNDIHLKHKNENLTFSDEGKILNMPHKADHILINIENKSNIIGIIDGQHRVFAYHEGSDAFETTISKLRKRHSLLVTGIIMPPKWNPMQQIKFQSKLFLEINSTQQSAGSKLNQEIESFLHPSSPANISKSIINLLNASGPLNHCFALHLADEHKIKTASIISFSLNILIRPGNAQGLWALWSSDRKSELLQKDNEDVDIDLLDQYIAFCHKTILDFLIAVRQCLSKEVWKISTPQNDGILNVTTINGFLNCIRQLVIHSKISDQTTYHQKLNGMGNFDFKKYKSSQYNKMGLDLYETFFK